MASLENADGETGGGYVTREKFRQFDVVNDDSDHSYLNWKKPSNKGGSINGPDCFSNASSGVHKRIMKEWRVLEKSLPESIYVRVYERRIDLLRAAIVGAAGTPYHDGLFFFDLSFPPDYPTRPPKVHYRSFGLRINPNLYANGTVCLSLLNTWSGTRKEKWNPAESTVLQVLISIQGLVLNTEPYFNEPGVGLFPGRAKRSTAYSENAFLLSCKTMAYLIGKPPKNFEDIVASHFRDRAQGILAACHAYIRGQVRVGHYDVVIGSGGSSSELINVSSSFKEGMKKWYPVMVASFRSTGASLGDFVEQFWIEKKATPSNVGASCNKKKAVSSGVVVIKKTTKCGVGKAIRKLMEMLGLKKLGKRQCSTVIIT